MKKNYFILFIGLACSVFLLINSIFTDKKSIDFAKTNSLCKIKGNKFPNEWMFMQRAYPYGIIDQETYLASLKIRKELMDEKIRSKDKSVFNNNWIFSGPTNIGGRITDIEMPLSNMQTIYAGIASGGIFKTTNTGNTWIPVFDQELTLHIGDLAIAKTNENIIYVGTGEANGGGGSVAYDGLGVYKSTNAGNSWIHLGLTNIGNVGKVEIDPNNPDKVYVAAMGKLFANNSERGVFRTTNGGTNWEKVLFISDSTGAIDLAVNPVNSDYLYAAMWERIRRPNRNQYGGITSGIYLSTNGGNNWVELTNGLPSAASLKGRIVITVAASSPNILYAMYATTSGYLQGIYKSTNNGDSWFTLNSSGIYAPSFMWWFGKIYADPTNADKVFITSLDAYYSSDGGNSWNDAFPEAHVDHHTFFVHPSNPNLVLNGNDGGVYISYNGGVSSTKINNLPITQFYTSEVDYNFPNRLYGGAQDNSSMRTMTGNIDDWQIIYMGDGFYTLVDPSNNQYVYAEYQYGNFARSVNGGSSFVTAMNGISSGDRKNWNTPVVIDPLDPAVLYYGANRLYKSTNRAVSWSVISGDLTNGSGGGNLVYGTITTISVSPLNHNIIYAGTDDGNIWITQDAGSNWTKISSALPNRWVTRVAADPANISTAYAAFSGYRFNSNTAYIYKTTNYGNSWTDVTGNLPETPVNDIIINPDNHQLYIATDIGVFYSLDDGLNWSILGLNLPNVIVTDLTYHSPTKMLVAGTFGRSMYKYDLSSLFNIKETDCSDFAVSIFPNPFMSGTSISLQTNVKDHYTVCLYNLKGLKIADIFDDVMEPGNHKIHYNASGLANGIYICRIYNNKGLLKEVKIVRIN